MEREAEEEGGAMVEEKGIAALAVAAAAQGRWRQLKGGGGSARAAPAIGTTSTEVTGPRQGEVAAGVAAARGCAAAAEAVVGLLPRSSMSSHLRGCSFLSFFK